MELAGSEYLYWDYPTKGGQESESETMENAQCSIELAVLVEKIFDNFLTTLPLDYIKLKPVDLRGVK